MKGTLSIKYWSIFKVKNTDTGRKIEFAPNLPGANMLQIWNLQRFATSAKVAMAEFAQKRANSAITTLALGAKLCKAHICNIRFFVLWDFGQFWAACRFYTIKFKFFQIHAHLCHVVTRTFFFSYFYFLWYGTRNIIKEKHWNNFNRLVQTGTVTGHSRSPCWHWLI